MNSNLSTLNFQPFRNLLKSKDIPENQVPFWELWVKQYLRYYVSECMQVEMLYRRYHTYDTVFEKIFQEAVRASGIPRRIKVHTLRHMFGTDLLAAGYDIRQVQDLLGHADVRTTMIYTHIVRPDQKPIKSPLDIMREREVGEDEDKKKVEAKDKVEVDEMMRKIEDEEKRN
jgi:hypothetical protein